jgi:hypothetical protein
MILLADAAPLILSAYEAVMTLDERTSMAVLRQYERRIRAIFGHAQPPRLRDLSYPEAAVPPKATRRQPWSKWMPQKR